MIGLAAGVLAMIGLDAGGLASKIGLIGAQIGLVTPQGRKVELAGRLV